MHFFLDQDFSPLFGVLSEEESRHATKSLRVRIGEHIQICDGKGSIFTAEIQEIGKKQIILKVLHADRFEQAVMPIHIAIAPTKNTARIEWFIEKATELGVDRIFLLKTKRTERQRINHERCERIVHAAAKQSKRAFIPKVESNYLLSDIYKNANGTKYIAHCDENHPKKHISKLISQWKSESITVLIGPEGDFSPVEISEAISHNFVAIDLGINRLRTETAGLFVASIAVATRENL